MNELNIESISIDNNKYLISWNIERKLPSITNQQIEITYDFNLSDNYIFPINILLSLLLPILSIDDDVIRINSPVTLPSGIIEYWIQKLKIIHKKDIKLEVFCSEANTCQYFDNTKDNNLNLSNIGLFFGGGVESLFALSKIYHKKPILISIVGDQWMNNNLPKYSIKQKLEEQLVADHDLNIQRVTTNIRLIINAKDSFMNKYATGFVFYFLALPIADRFDIKFFFKSSEMEEALNFSDYDFSLNPRTTTHISIPDNHFPLILPVYNSYSKIQMFEELSQTDFIIYLYSCLKNSELRWCGKCGKCIRISRYCEILKFDKHLIDMQEGIKGKRETSPISKNYWILMDSLYSNKKSFLKKIFK